MHNADLSHIPRNPWPMTTYTQEGGNNTRGKHKTTKHTHTHTQMQLHPTWIGALGMCPRYPVPCLAAFLPWKFLRGMDHQPSRGDYSTKCCFYIIIWTYQLFEEGVSQAEAYPEPRRRQCSPAWVTWIYCMTTHDPPSALVISRGGDPRSYCLMVPESTSKRLKPRLVGPPPPLFVRGAVPCRVVLCRWCIILLLHALNTIGHREVLVYSVSY